MIEARLNPEMTTLKYAEHTEIYPNSFSGRQSIDEAAGPAESLQNSPSARRTLRQCPLGTLQEDFDENLSIEELSIHGEPIVNLDGSNSNLVFRTKQFNHAGNKISTFTNIDDDCESLEEVALGSPVGTSNASFNQFVRPRRVRYYAPNDLVSADRDTGTYYPAPIPAQLQFPPLLSVDKKRSRRNTSGSKLARYQAHLYMPRAPQWQNSPLFEEVTTVRVGSDGSTYSPCELGTVSVLDGDLETDLNGSDDNLSMVANDDPANTDDAGSVSTNHETTSENGKEKSLLDKAWHAIINKQGIDEQNANGCKDESEDIGDVAFSKYDPEVIEEHLKNFATGKVYSNSSSAFKAPTSLIEEIEIRKAGRRIQHSLLTQEAESLEHQRTEHVKNHKHPLDQVVQPTLMDLQNLANKDYLTRTRWHSNAINHTRGNESLKSHAQETLAQRRVRLLNEKKLTNSPLSQTATSPLRSETLAERRARLKREKEQSHTSFHPHARSSKTARNTSLLVDSSRASSFR